MQTESTIPGLEQPEHWFSGHESFAIRHGWLPKAVTRIKEYPDIFLRDDALVLLGVGKNMVRSIRHWALATRVLAEGSFVPGTRSRSITPSALGELLFGDGAADPYLEDPATLWVLHWELSGKKDGPTVWWWMFNELHDVEFTKARVLASLLQYVGRTEGKKIAEQSVSKDIDCLIRSYLTRSDPKEGIAEESLECPLVELGLLQELDDGVLAFNRGEHPSLPPAVVAYATLDYWDRMAPHKNTMTFDQVAYQPGSPGRVFKLTENALSEHLEAIEGLTHKKVTYDVTAGLRQLYRRPPVEALSVLCEYYDKNRGR